MSAERPRRRASPRAPLVLTALDMEPIRDGAVRVRGAEIVAVDTASRLGVEDGERAGTSPDATLLPGLIDAHEHLPAMIAMRSVTRRCRNRT